MEFIRGLHNLRPRHRGCALTIGNFDGVHRGHQLVIAQLAARAAALRMPALVMLFEPHPLEYFRPQDAPPRLMRLREKLMALATLPVDRVLCVRFNARVAQLPPQAFVEEILVRSLGARYVVVGEDFRYGHQRAGDIESLTRAGREHGFEAGAAATFMIDGERVSSTRVRAALVNGDMRAAEKLLGRPYSMYGHVMHGDKIGRTIGVPTANIALQRHRAAIDGIFVVELCIGNERLPAVASIGTRPTVGGTERLLEVHALDFNRDIYGTHVKVDFLHRIREERRFDSVEEMRQCIDQDIAVARQYFNGQRPPRAAAGFSRP
ncbi:MAG: bifunctional riboflavin kinase/FAD synthetase [Sulfurifustis sp.]